MRLLKNLLIKKLSKEKKKKVGLKFDRKNPMRMKSKKKYRKQKQISIKKIRTELERFKNQGGNSKSFLI